MNRADVQHLLPPEPNPTVLTVDKLLQCHDRLSFGFALIPAPLMVRQCRWPRSKKKRIRAKWAGRPENFAPMEDFLVDEAAGQIFGHPDVIAKLREKYDNRRS